MQSSSRRGLSRRGDKGVKGVEGASQAVDPRQSLRSADSRPGARHGAMARLAISR